MTFSEFYKSLKFTWDFVIRCKDYNSTTHGQGVHVVQLSLQIRREKYSDNNSTFNLTFYEPSVSFEVLSVVMTSISCILSTGEK